MVVPFLIGFLGVLGYCYDLDPILILFFMRSETVWLLSLIQTRLIWWLGCFTDALPDITNQRTLRPATALWPCALGWLIGESFGCDIDDHLLGGGAL